MARKHTSITLALCALGLATSGCGERVYEYYGRMTIDPATLRVTLLDTIGVSRGEAGRFYFRFTDARRRPGITYGEADVSGRTIGCYDNLSLDSTYTLTHRSKSQELWRGEFGLVLSQTSYFYATQYRGQGTGFVTVPNANMNCVEHPVVLASPPDTVGLRLDVISVVRVYGGDNGYTVVAGNYSPAGALQSISRGRIAGPPAASPDDVRATEVGTQFIRQPPDSAQVLGFKTSIDPRARNLGAASRADQSKPHRELVSYHYNRSVVVKQTADSADVSMGTRWIRFPPSYADTALTGIDSTRQFGLTTWLRRD